MTEEFSQESKRAARAALMVNRAKREWDSRADDLNQWSELSEIERLEVVAEFATRVTGTRVLAALEIGLAAKVEEANQYHVSHRGYSPNKHAKHDAEVRQIREAVDVLNATNSDDGEQERAWQATRAIEVAQELVAHITRAELAILKSGHTAMIGKPVIEGDIPLYTYSVPVDRRCKHCGEGVTLGICRDKNTASG